MPTFPLFCLGWQSAGNGVLQARRSRLAIPGVKRAGRAGQEEWSRLCWARPLSPPSFGGPNFVVPCGGEGNAFVWSQQGRKAMSNLLGWGDELVWMKSCELDDLAGLPEEGSVSALPGEGWGLAGTFPERPASESEENASSWALVGTNCEVTKQLCWLENKLHNPRMSP